MTTWTMTRRQLRQWLGPVLPHAPLLICHGERFVGLQMPRPGADDWTPDGWLALLPPPSGEEDAA